MNTGTISTQQKICLLKFICWKDNVLILNLLYKTPLWWKKHDGTFQRLEWCQFQPLCFQNALNCTMASRVRAGMLKNVMGKTGPGQSNLLIKQETHPGIDGSPQGAAVSDLLWGNSSVLGMCSHPKVSWRLFELIPSYSSLSSLRFTPRLWRTQWCCFKKYVLSFFFLHLPGHW